MWRLPPPNTGQGPGSSWTNRLRSYAETLGLIPGPGIKIERRPNGTVISVDPSGGGGATAPMQMYKLQSVQDDYLTCRSWDGTNMGTQDILIAKDHKLRTSLQTATIYGVVHNYTYAAGPDANNKQRTNTWPGAGNTENELVTPAWLVNDIIYAMPAKTDLTVAGKKLGLLDVRPCRQWAAI